MVPRFIFNLGLFILVYYKFKCNSSGYIFFNASGGQGGAFKQLKHSPGKPEPKRNIE
jgi:hypothetical protein